MSNIIPSKLVANLRDKLQFEEKSYFDDATHKNQALIIVDIQNDFLPNGALAVNGGDEIIPLINELQKQFELVVLTQDWHPKNHHSFASSHKSKNAYEVIELNGLEQVLWPDHCVQGSKGAEFSALLEVNKASLIIRKGIDPSIDSYSAFFDNGRLNSTGLAGYLIEKGIQKVSVCGLAADFCVYFTAMDALELGFEVEIIGDATKAIDPQAYQDKLETFKSKGGTELTASF
jgi:nicotinamidase/pyrazinamidase